MCAVSKIADSYTNDLTLKYGWVNTLPRNLPVSRDEFDLLRIEVQELKLLLQAAKKFDTATGQPDCEKDEKIAIIKQLANLFDIDMGDVFTNG